MAHSLSCKHTSIYNIEAPSSSFKVLSSLNPAFLGVTSGYTGYLLGVYWDTGEENRRYCSIIGYIYSSIIKPLDALNS